MEYDRLIDQTEAYMQQNDWKAAMKCACEAVRRNRLNLRANYMLAVCAENVGEWMESYQHYSVLYKLQSIYDCQVIPMEELILRINKAMDKAVCVLQSLKGAEAAAFRNGLLAANEEDKDISGNYFAVQELMNGYFGIHRYFGREYYIGRYNAWFPDYSFCSFLENGVCLKSEIYEVLTSGKSVAVDESFTSFPCVLPVVTDVEPQHNNLTVKTGTDHSRVFDAFDAAYVKAYKHFRLDSAVQISAEHPMVVGKPIPLRHTEGNKKLILNIFIDSFNYKTVKGDRFKHLMPYTYKFFSRGVLCNSFYSGSEFTYPSVASYWTGLRPTHHHLLNSNVHYPIYENMPILSEIFHDNKYFTAKIGGNYSVCPQYGYIRGIDRTLYGYSEGVFHADAVVAEGIEHIEAFRDTDQFLWLEFQDLHYVAGYWPMPLSVETHLPFEVNEVDHTGGSSLYQTPSPHRRMVYEQQLKYIDRQLNSLYNYILENYSEDEIIVSLISDHGNGFNVDEGNYFICEQRMNVPLMLRGGGLCAGVCEEMIETIDYGHIMAHLAKIEDDRLSRNDGKLPVFFGGTKEKEYVLSQSLFPNRYYSAMILGRNYKFYIQSKNLVENDCRVSLQDADIDLRDAEDIPLEDEEIFNSCIDIIVEQLGDFLL